MPTWPATLPEYVLEGGYGEDFAPQTLETEMDLGGFKKRRRRFTKAIERFAVSIAMTPAQAATFRTFYYADCAAGSLPFTWAHPRTRAAMDFAFTGPPPKLTAHPGSGGERIDARFAMQTA